MELHYTVATVLFVVLVLVLCFVTVSMFIPIYWSGRSYPLFNTTTTTYSTTSSIETTYTHTESTTTITTTTLLTSPPSGELRVKSYYIKDRGDDIQVGLVFDNTYPVEVIIEKIYLNNTLVHEGPRVIIPWEEIPSTTDPEILVTVWISTGIKPVPGSEVLVCGKMIPMGNLTIIYRIPNVQGVYNTTLTLKIPECMIKSLDNISNP